MYQQVELYEEPRKILEKMQEGYCEMSPAQHGFLCGLLRQYTPHKVVEIGVAGGGTTAVIMKCLELLENDTMMYSVDKNRMCYRRETETTGYQLKEVKDSLKNYHNHKFLLGHILPEVIEEIGGDIDFVVLDTVHTLPGELFDFLCILPYLKDGAVIVMHDTSLNLSEGNASFATKIVLDTAIGKKYYNYQKGNIDILNIGAIEVGQDTRACAANLFSAFSISWMYLPPKMEIDAYRKAYESHYDEECIQLFDIFVKAQYKVWEEKVKIKDFLETDKLSSLVELKDIEQNIGILYEHFMGINDEVIYVMNDGEIYGVVSIGDLCRHYENGAKVLEINRQFRSISSPAAPEAKDIFWEFEQKIHEIPVVKRENFLGVVRCMGTKSYDDWIYLRNRLKSAKVHAERNISLDNRS